MKKFILLMMCGLSLSAQAQKKCTTHDNFIKKAENDPSVLVRKNLSEIRTQQWIQNNPKNKTQQIITIPVVVHVVYNTTTENISDAQIQSQIDVLNEDFRLMNADSLPSNHPFWGVTVDSQIEFCLAKRDPNGAATTGITRTFTSTTGFAGNGEEKHTNQGGKDNWDPTKYLNLWVCNLGNSGGTLGYATFPSDLASSPGEDGVVIHFEAFGNIGTAGQGQFTANDKGRTGSHEVGHWLNLSHIWGDQNCGDDMVADTEPAQDANYGCPTFPHRANNSCGSGANGEMYMNYMDYVDDACMMMFTTGQGNRMRAALNGDRSGLLTSQACTPSVSIQKPNFSSVFEIYPNPNNGIFEIKADNFSDTNISITVYNVLGAKVASIENIKSFPNSLNLSNLENGVYEIKITSDKQSSSKKIVINK